MSGPARPLAPSERLLRVASIFGLRLAQHHSSARRASARPGSNLAAGAIDARLAPGGLAFITGPSGVGKSLALQALRRRLGDASLSEGGFPAPGDRRRPLADLSPLPLDAWLATLARAGLAEAPLWRMPYSSLSEGQRARARLALLLAEAACSPARRDGSPCRTLLIDGFCEPLDRLTARSVAAALRRWLDNSPPGRAAVRIVVASAHDDLLEPLRPDLVVHMPLSGPAEVLAP